MAHEIESMMYVGAQPWHKLGRKLDRAPTSVEAIRAAGLDWSVSLEPLYTADGFEIESHRAAQRDRDGRILGVVGAKYRPLQNAEAFAWFDPFVAAGEASYECAGSLREGARVWVLAKLARDPAEIVPGDPVEKYVLLSNGHDGSLAVRVGFTPIRVVCANTLRLAHDDAASKLIRIKHTSGVAAALEDVRAVMDMADASFEATAEQYRALARHQVHAGDLERYVSQVFELQPDRDGGRKSRVQTAVAEYFENGQGNTLPGVRGSWWAAYNAVTEYLTHGRGSDDATRLDSAWYGDGAARNGRALQFAYQHVTAAAA